MDVRWSVGPDGSLSLETRVRVEEAAPFLPRFGIRLFLDAGLEKAAYFGYGPYESYADAHRASHMGRFLTTARDGYVPYIRPQEHGNRHACVYAEVTDGTGWGLRAEGRPRFDFPSCLIRRKNWKRHPTGRICPRLPGRCSVSITGRAELARIAAAGAGAGLPPGGKSLCLRGVAVPFAAVPDGGIWGIGLSFPALIK